MARVNVSLPDEQKDWLDAQPELTASGLLQWAIHEKQTQTHDFVKPNKAIRDRDWLTSANTAEPGMSLVFDLTHHDLGIREFEIESVDTSQDSVDIVYYDGEEETKSITAVEVDMRSDVIIE